MIFSLVRGVFSQNSAQIYAIFVEERPCGGKYLFFSTFFAAFEHFFTQFCVNWEVI